jgi:outer membrane murein-binding lipoprotein Lpp
MISEAAQRRQDAYDNAVAALHRVNPKAVPVARPSDAFAIPLVAQQARDASPPALPAPSPEHMLIGRVNAMQNACASLFADAKRKGIRVEWPAIKDDLGLRLQTLNAFHDQLEKKIEYHNNTTPERRAIDTLNNKVARLENRVDAMTTAMTSLADLIPLLMKQAEAVTPRRGKKGP